LQILVLVPFMFFTFDIPKTPATQAGNARIILLVGEHCTFARKPRTLALRAAWAVTLNWEGEDIKVHRLLFVAPSLEAE